MKLEDGPTAPAEVRRRSGSGLDVTIREGRKRQVRRMAEAVGNEVASLERIRIGSLELGDLPAGDSRLLGEAEVAALWEDSGPDEPSHD